MSKLVQLANTKLSMFRWMLKYPWNYFILNFQSVSTISKNYIFLLLLFILATPWLSGILWLSLLVNIISVFSFLQLIQDKIQVENEKTQIRRRIQNEIDNEIGEILEFLEKVGVPDIKKILKVT